MYCDTLQCAKKDKIDNILRFKSLVLQISKKKKEIWIMKNGAAIHYIHKQNNALYSFKAEKQSEYLKRSLLQISMA